jgi:hypothetical protein
MQTARQILREVANRRCDSEARTRRADYRLALATLMAAAASARRPKAAEETGVPRERASSSTPLDTEAASPELKSR